MPETVQMLQLSELIFLVTKQGFDLRIIPSVYPNESDVRISYFIDSEDDTGAHFQHVVKTDQPDFGPKLFEAINRCYQEAKEHRKLYGGG